jgi:hypothetical protein
MPTRKEISKIRAEYLTQRDKAMRARLSVQQEKMYEQLIREINEKYGDLSNSDLSPSEYNRMINQVERTIKNLATEGNTEIVKQLISDTKGLGNMNQMYFSTLTADAGVLESIKSVAEKAINKKLGLDAEGSLKERGFLDRMISDPFIQKNVISEVRKAYTKGYDTQTFREKLKQIIVGGPEASGVFQRHYTTFAKDILNSINGAQNNIYRKELGLKSAYYAGGLITTSRSLCIKNNGKIFNTDQIEALREDPFIVKMYGENIADYDPYELPGGYGCLHNWDWITEDLAEGKREQNKKAKKRNDKFKERNDL